MRQIPRFFLKSKAKAINSGSSLIRVLSGIKEKDAKSNRCWNETRQELEAKHILQREIVKNLALGAKEKILLQKTMELDRRMDVLFAQSIEGKTISNKEAMVLAGEANLALGRLDEPSFKKVRSYNPFIKKTIQGTFESLVKSKKRQIVPPEIVRQMKLIIWQETNQKMGFDIYKEIEDIRKKISHN